MQNKTFTGYMGSCIPDGTTTPYYTDGNTTLDMCNKICAGDHNCSGYEYNKKYNYCKLYNIYTKKTNFTTEEDDRDLDGEKIIEDIAVGVKKTGKVLGKDLFYIHKREEAVEKAISMAKKDDLVLLLGKGEETVIITNKPGFKPSANHIYNESTDVLFRHYNETETATKVLKKIIKR